MTPLPALPRDPAVSSRLSGAFAVPVAVALLAYLLYFFSLDLPNSGPAGSRINRLQVWQIALGWTELPAPALATLRSLARGHYLADRAQIAAYALLIVEAALGIGAISLTLLRLPNSLVSDGMDMTAAEWLVMAYGVGMSLLALVTLGLGLAGWMVRGAVVAGFGAAALGLLVGWARARRALARHAEVSRRRVRQAAPGGASRAFIACAVACGVLAGLLFLLVAFLGAMLPATDFDVREYHLQAPKEFYLGGRIAFMPHNVYANMPLGTEMMSLLAMILAGDWWRGALVGQAVLASFMPMTALAVYALGRRLFSPASGLLAALVYVTTPWVYRIAIIPYTEGALCFFLAAATLAATLAWTGPAPRAGRCWLLAGLLAGAAAACKYTAILTTVAPLFGAALVGPAWRRHAAAADATSRPCSGFTSAVVFLLGVLVTLGPWLAKNAILTGNPTYPLLYRVFGGTNWTPEKNAKWEWAHRVPLLVALGIERPPDGRPVRRDDDQHGITPGLLASKFGDVTARADWLSPLLFGLAPLALVRAPGRRAARWLWLFAAYLFFDWWLLTHRLDRFWVPLIPLVAVLAGAGASWTAARGWRWFMVPVVAGCVFFNFSFCVTALCGNNNYTARIDPARRDPSDAAVNEMNRELPARARVLAVGAADLFHLNRQLVYNTVFDDCLFEQWVRGRSPAEAASAFGSRGVTHVYVSWAEIERYRGTYGYSDFVTPAVFDELVRSGVLRRLSLGPGWIVSRVGMGDRDVPAVELYEVVRGP